MAGFWSFSRTLRVTTACPCLMNSVSVCWSVCTKLAYQLKDRHCLDKHGQFFPWPILPMHEHTKKVFTRHGDAAPNPCTYRIACCQHSVSQSLLYACLQMSFQLQICHFLCLHHAQTQLKTWHCLFVYPGNGGWQTEGDHGGMMV